MMFKIYLRKLLETLVSVLNIRYLLQQHLKWLHCPHSYVAEKVMFNCRYMYNDVDIEETN